MLKRTISYEDFNGNQVSEVFYFNITKTELIELELSYDVGFQETLQAIIENEDHRRLVEEFKKIVLFAYGIKSDDGKSFVKSEELRTAFASTAAYNALFIELATDSDQASLFINGIMPKDMAETPDQDKPQGPPRPSAAPAPAPLSPPQG